MKPMPMEMTVRMDDVLMKSVVAVIPEVSMVQSVMQSQTAQAYSIVIPSWCHNNNNNNNNNNTLWCNVMDHANRSLADSGCW
jgi:hypothetical protein